MTEAKDGWSYKIHPYRLPSMGERMLLEIMKDA
jgi:hypothetical protein